MSIHIIDKLKVINIKLRCYAVLLRILLQILNHLFFKSVPVINSGQAVCCCKLLKLLPMFVKNQQCSGNSGQKQYNQTSSAYHHIEILPVNPAILRHHL